MTSSPAKGTTGLDLLPAGAGSPVYINDRLQHHAGIG